MVLYMHTKYCLKAVLLVLSGLLESEKIGLDSWAFIPMSNTFRNYILLCLSSKIKIVLLKTLRCLCDESDCWCAVGLGEGWTDASVPDLTWNLLDSGTPEGMSFNLSSRHTSWFIALNQFMETLLAQSAFSSEISR